ncbi:MAG: hypothetical protein ABI460_06890 [Caldimonas sp.]
MTSSFRNPRATRLWLHALAVIALAGCGGGGSGGSSPPAVTSVTRTIVAAVGGTIDGPGGTTLTIPPNALAADTAITIALDATGAPALPAVLTPADLPMIALLPHGTTFGVPVTLSLPLPAGAAPVVAKTNPERDGWEVVPSTTMAGRLIVAMTSFSNVSIAFVCLPSPIPLTCADDSPPEIIGEPRDSPQLGEGAFWIFRVDVVAAAPYTFRWRRNGFGLPNETNQDILVNPLKFSDDGDLYSVVVTDRFGRSVTSRAALLKVSAAAPTIINHPNDAQVAAGQTAVFVAASTSSIAQTLAWKRCNTSEDCTGGPTTWQDTGNQAPVHRVFNAARFQDDGARFAFCATNATGTTCSSSATLTVLALPVPPQIVTPPQAVTTAAGTSAGFTVVATGGALSFDWQGSHDGVNFAPEPRCTDSATCTLSTVAFGDDGLLLRVRVFNTAGSALASPPALLTVRLASGVAVARVAGTDQNSIGLRADGRLVEWGGPLGSVTSMTPVVSPFVDSVATLADGSGHSLAIRSNGDLFAWGDNSSGQLGDGTTQRATVPQRVPGLAPVRSAAAGIGASRVLGNDESGYTIAVDAANGLVFAWGTNVSGQLGDGTTTPRPNPVPVGRISGVTGIAAGGGHVLARRSDGSVWAWGRNTAGQLGTGNTMASVRPVPVPLADIVAVAAGNEFSVALRSDGVVLTWGSNNYAKLGDGLPDDRSVPAPIALPAPAIAIAAGVDHGLALLVDGRVYAWGRNDFGQAGTGTVGAAVATPQRVVGPLPADIVAIGSGAYHSLALDRSGNVWAWGSNDTHQLLDGTQLNRLTPVQVQGVNLN